MDRQRSESPEASCDHHDEQQDGDGQLEDQPNSDQHHNDNDQEFGPCPQSTQMHPVKLPSIPDSLRSRLASSAPMRSHSRTQSTLAAQTTIDQHEAARPNQMHLGHHRLLPSCGHLVATQPTGAVKHLVEPGLRVIARVRMNEERKENHRQDNVEQFCAKQRRYSHSECKINEQQQRYSCREQRSVIAELS